MSTISDKTNVTSYQPLKGGQVVVKQSPKEDGEQVIISGEETKGNEIMNPKELLNAIKEEVTDPTSNFVQKHPQWSGFVAGLIAGLMANEAEKSKEVQQTAAVKEVSSPPTDKKELLAYVEELKKVIDGTGHCDSPSFKIDNRYWGPDDVYLGITQSHFDSFITIPPGSKKLLYCCVDRNEVTGEKYPKIIDTQELPDEPVALSNMYNHFGVEGNITYKNPDLLSRFKMKDRTVIKGIAIKEVLTKDSSQVPEWEKKLIHELGVDKNNPDDQQKLANYIKELKTAVNKRGTKHFYANNYTEKANYEMGNRFAYTPDSNKDFITIPPVGNKILYCKAEQDEVDLFEWNPKIIDSVKLPANPVALSNCCSNYHAENLYGNITYEDPNLVSKFDITRDRTFKRLSIKVKTEDLTQQGKWVNDFISGIEK